MNPTLNVFRRFAAAPPERNPEIVRLEELSKTHVLFSPLRGVKTNELLCGFAQVERCVLQTVHAHTYPTRHRRTADGSLEGARADANYTFAQRFPGATVSSIVAANSGEGIGEVRALRGAHQDFTDAVQLLTFPVLPQTILDIVNVLEAIVNRPLEDVSAQARELASRHAGDAAADLLEQIDWAEEVISTGIVATGQRFGDKVQELKLAIREMLAIAQGGQIYAERCADRYQAELEDASSGKTGKKRPDRFDTYMFNQLGRTVPRITRNLVGESKPSVMAGAAPAVGAIAGAEQRKRCTECAEEILAAARRCRYCGSAQEMAASATTLPVPQPPAPEPVVDVAVDDDDDAPVETYAVTPVDESIVGSGVTPEIRTGDPSEAQPRPQVQNGRVRRGR